MYIDVLHLEINCFYIDLDFFLILQNLRNRTVFTRKKKKEIPKIYNFSKLYVQKTITVIVICI